MLDPRGYQKRVRQQWMELGTPNNPGMIRQKMIHCA
jgi:hypothetical protein